MKVQATTTQIIDPADRRYDIDWLRVITIGLLLFYHVAIVFQPWGIYIGFIQSIESLEKLWIPMTMLNIWRIPLLFFISGMGVYFAMKKRNIKILLVERIKRILLPFVFGVFCIVPIHLYIWESYYSQDLNLYPNVSHLWFLGNIFIYTLILSPLFYYLQKNKAARINQALSKILRNPLGLIALSGLFIIEAMLTKPDIFELYAVTWHGFYMGLLSFLLGFWFALNGSIFWKVISKWKLLFLCLAISLFVIRHFVFEAKAPSYLMSIESILWIYSVFGLGYRYLNKPSKTLSYLSQAAYPIYIIHMVFIFLGATIILPWNIHVVLKLILVNGFTYIGSLLLYHFMIKRVKFIRPLFGMT